ncbi:MAG TPA: pyridoxal phosphate-dependent aminotransferase [Bacteroidales bacterium]|nr:pyridoxal phosphate-dependent aminotransferase [Bacteroidales bacterium]HRX95840.1 pyridoxal phosphate-dependent aminotransferase [Bacteroidales bacterium]
MGILSDRINRLSESATLEMARKSRELKEQGIDVINLSIGEPDFDTPDDIKAAAHQAIDDNLTHYTPVPGTIELRRAIAKKLKEENNLNFAPDQIVVSNGAKQSIANALLCLVNPGDEVIVPSPYWVSYPEMVKLAEGEMVEIKAQIDQDFKVTAEQVEAVITPKSKVFLFSSPCNPSGSVYTHDELKALAEVFEKHPNIFIISDEIYEYINFNGSHESIAQFESIRDQVIIINGVSKGYAMTGWRIGYMAAIPEIAKACSKLQGQVTSGPSSISQQASVIAIEKMNAQSKDVLEMLNAFRERRELVLNLLKEIPGVIPNEANGAFYIFPNMSYYFGKSNGSTTIKNDEDLCLYLLDKAHIACVSGGAFGNDQCIRLSYATSSDLLKEALHRMKEALSKLK